SRAPFVMPMAETAFSRAAEIHDTTFGWRFVNPAMDRAYGTDSMPQTGQNVADDYGIDREAQDAMALSSQQKAAASIASGRLAREITPVSVPQRKGDPRVVDSDEHPRATTPEALAKLRPLFTGGSVTAGNASGVNDGAAALILASEAGARRHGLTPIARVLGGAAAGVP
ncbi:MAG: 3-oxoadipyl-CoA thiolase, partial [Pararhodobacter sp.]